ncbi:hypothetical protein At1D1108_50780 (plasmid) [Agrobacterium tumefaciens]|nr:hypothetical protein At1D1108_50780 [Agrobacterium tumefaciens]
MLEERGRDGSGRIGRRIRVAVLDGGEQAKVGRHSGFKEFVIPEHRLHIGVYGEREIAVKRAQGLIAGHARNRLMESQVAGDEFLKLLMVGDFAAIREQAMQNLHVGIGSIARRAPCRLGFEHRSQIQVVTQAQKAKPPCDVAPIQPGGDERSFVTANIKDIDGRQNANGFPDCMECGIEHDGKVLLVRNPRSARPCAAFDLLADVVDRPLDGRMPRYRRQGVRHVRTPYE